MTTPGTRIREKRKALEMSQARLASLVGISQSSLCELELGDSKMPSAPVLHKLAHALGVTPGWIMTGKDGAVEAISDQEAAHIQALRALSMEEQRAIYNLAETMAKDKH